VIPGIADDISEGRMEITVWRRRLVVVAGPLITQGLFYKYYIRRSTHRNNLTSGGDADEQLAPGDEEFLCYEHSKRRSYHTPDNATFDPLVYEQVKGCMITRPGRIVTSLTCCMEVINQVTVWIKHADARNLPVPQSFLSSRLA
jgi:hypothetical protein